MAENRHRYEIEQLALQFMDRLKRLTTFLMVLMVLLYVTNLIGVGVTSLGTMLLKCLAILAPLLTAWMERRDRQQLIQVVGRLELHWIRLKALLTFETEAKGEAWVKSLGWFVPRKYRNDVVGDILEDCAEMREVGCKERRIKVHVVYQWLIAVITLVPTAVKTSITEILKQVISPPK